MKEIIEWLETIELRAARIYEKAAERFSGDAELSAFLRLMAEDERLHYHIVCRAGEMISGRDDAPGLIYMSDDTREEIESYLDLFEKRIGSRDLTRARLIEYIIAIESAEGNDLFLYMVNTLKHGHKEFIPYAAKIQQHKRRIEAFVERNPDLEELKGMIRGLTTVWKERFLVIDDRDEIADALRSVLDDEGAVETVRHGSEALKRIMERYYAAVIVGSEAILFRDIYKEAVDLFPSIRNRFIVFSGHEDSEKLEFARANHLRCIPSPSQLKDIRKTLMEVLSG